MATGGGICTDHPDADLIDYRGDPICSECGQVVVIREAFVMIQCPDHPQAHLICNESGDQICSECSLVIAEKIIHVGSEWNPFCKDEEESEDEKESEGEEVSGYPSTVDVADKSRLNGTNLTTTMNNMTTGLSPRVGNVASFENRRPVAVYKNKQKRSSSDQTLSEAFEDINKMANLLHLTDVVIERANRLCEDVYHSRDHSKKLKAHSLDAIRSACLNIACRQEGVPRTFEEICAVSPIHYKGIDVCMKLILQERNISLDSYPTPDFIPRFCGNLNLGIPIENIAKHIIRKAVEFDTLTTPRRSPGAVAATAVFMAARASDKQFAKNEICNATGVADGTIRTVYKLMRPRAAELFPADFNLDLSKLPRSYRY